MNRVTISQAQVRVGEVLCWLAFYLTIHFNINDEHLSFWLPMKFIVAVPLTVFCLLVVYGFGWLFGRPLDTPVHQLLLFGVVSFGLLHVVYYYAYWAAQPYTPSNSVTCRRWVGIMEGNGPFYFLRNPHYVLTVSSFLYSSMIGLPIGVKLLRDTLKENKQLAAARQQQVAWEMEAVRTRLNPGFFQQTLAHITTLLTQQQASIAAEMTLKLAQVLRHTLYETSTASTNLQHELDAYLDYIQLQELRLQNRIEVTLRLTVQTAGNEAILTGILLPLTEHVLLLAVSFCEIELRVHHEQLFMYIQVDPVSEQAAPLDYIRAMQARLAQHTTGGRLRYGQQREEFALWLTLPLQLVAA